MAKRSQAWKQFEREIVVRMKELGQEAHRNWSEQFMQHSATDVYTSGPYGEWIIQCKYGIGVSLLAAFMEAKSAAKPKQTPIAMCRHTKANETLVVLRLKDFERLVNNNDQTKT